METAAKLLRTFIYLALMAVSLAAVSAAALIIGGSITLIYFFALR